MWNGEVAWATCDWFYRDRALIELRPEDARATVLYRWSVDDGNTPELRIVRACDGGRLFVIGETKQSTVVRVQPAAISANAVPLPGKSVLGAACREGAVELFIKVDSEHSIQRLTNGRLEKVRTLASAELPADARVIGAWFEGSRWHALVQTEDDGAGMAGALGGSFTRIAGGEAGSDLCAMGEPGGWLCNDASADAIVTRVEGAFRVTPFRALAVDTFVLSVGSSPFLSLTYEVSDGTKFSGLGELDFKLAEHGSVYAAQRANADVVVAKRAFSSLDIAARALPLSGRRVAVWGGLGDELIVLGPELRREDALGIVARTLRPFARFRSSANSLFDQVCYFVLLLGTIAWFTLLVRAGVRRWDDERRLRRFALIFVALFVVGVWGFYNVLIWI